MAGEAVIFIGASGRGKSTTAAALRRAGHLLLADDIVPVTLGQDRPMISAGFRQLKPWPSAVHALGHDPAALPLVVPVEQKRAQMLAHDLPRGPLPLKRIYVLSIAQDGHVSERLPQREAFMELVTHTYVVTFVRATGSATNHLRQCAAQVPVHRLKRKPTLAELDSLAGFIERDLQSDGAPAEPPH